MRKISFTVLGVLSLPKVAYAKGIGSIAAGIFSPGGVGFPIVSLLLLGLGSSLAKYLVSILGGSWSEFIRATSLLAGIGIVATAAWKALMAIAKVMGLA